MSLRHSALVVVALALSLVGGCSSSGPAPVPSEDSRAAHAIAKDIPAAEHTMMVTLRGDRQHSLPQCPFARMQTLLSDVEGASRFTANGAVYSAGNVTDSTEIGCAAQPKHAGLEAQLSFTIAYIPGVTLSPKDDHERFFEEPPVAGGEVFVLPSEDGASEMAVTWDTPDRRVRVRYLLPVLPGEDVVPAGTSNASALRNPEIAAQYRHFLDVLPLILHGAATYQE